jgi:uncharacterized protein YecE (DUF72 family)
MKKDFTIRIGTSGWTYKHWDWVFYPSTWPQSKWLAYYSEHFDTVELNASFYRLPKRSTFENWRSNTPNNFLWSVKGSRFVTHIKRLKNPAEPLDRLYDAVHGLKEKLGVILFQLPPNLVFDADLLMRFCKSLKPDIRHTLEVRHPSWFNDQMLEILRNFNIALCLADTAGRYPSCEAITADFVYCRLHGSKKLYVSQYSKAELKDWAEKILSWNRDTFIYFDNDAAGHAVRDAESLKKIVFA